MGILHKLGGRRRLLANPVTRNLARAAMRLNIGNLGDVTESFHGVFQFKGFGLSAYYDLGPHDTIGEVLYWRGLKQLEPYTLPWFIELAKQARGILDIGSNTGVYTLVGCAVNPEAKVIAWEPVPYLADKLRANVALNHLEGRCEVRQAAVAAQSGETDFYISEDTTMSSLSSRMATAGAHSMTKSRVRIERVDDALSSDFPVDLVKIDVEGYEFDALSGAVSMLERCHPNIIFECLPATAPGPIETLLRGKGYAIYRLSGNGPQEVAKISSSEDLEHNYLAWHPTRPKVTSLAPNK